MNIIIHRGTHQIGGSAIEISTKSTRIILDFGNELSLDEKYIPINLDIDGVTKGMLDCDGIVISHYHMDHLGQLTSALPEIPLYMGKLSKEVAMIATEHQDKDLYLRLLGANTFRGGEAFTIGNIHIRPLVIDHSAVDSYMFVIEAEGKRVLYTGDFRMHGLRSHIVEKLVKTYIGEVDVLITEGTLVSRGVNDGISEAAVLEDISSYIQDGKYVFVICSSTNIDRIMGIWQNMPSDKVLICDAYQKRILDTVINNVYYESSLYRRHDRPLVLNKGPYPKYYMDHGFVSLVRGTENYYKIYPFYGTKSDCILVEPQKEGKDDRGYRKIHYLSLSKEYPSRWQSPSIELVEASRSYEDSNYHPVYDKMDAYEGDYDALWNTD